MNNLYAVLEHCRRQFGPRLALSFRQRYRTEHWTYDELAQRVHRIAGTLSQKNIGPGSRVLLYGNNSLYWVAAFFAVLARRAVVIPLNPKSTASQLERIMASAEPELLLCTTHSTWQGPPIDTLLIEAAAKTGPAVKDMPGLNAEAGDLAEIVYTSGTTGEPKGIMLTHGNLLSGLHSLPSAIPLQETDTVLSIVPLFHLYGQMAGMLYPLSRGCMITYLPSLSSRVILGTLAQAPAHYMVAVPEFLKTFMDRLEDRLSGWPSLVRRLLKSRIRRRISKTLHTLVSGGAPLESELELKWRALGFEVLEGYGLTETSPMISINTAKAHRTGSVGKPLEGVQVRISGDGEIQIKGPNVMKGYYRDEARTRQAFQNGWLKTDDSGKLDEDGFLYVFGRKKYMILGPGGENVFPEDLEAELNRNPEVRDSAVVGLKHEGRTVIHAVLLSDYGNGEEMIQQANRHLAPHQHIMSWSIWPEADFPRSATRKVKKQDLVNHLDEKTKPPPDLAVSSTPFTRLIALVTNADPATIKESTRLVSDLKLDSLLRIELVGRIEEEFGVELAENQITADTTVADLQKLIEQHKGKASTGDQYPRWSLSTWCRPIRPTLQKLIFSLFKTMGKLRVEHIENLEELDGPVIFMANHLSYLDGGFTVQAIPPRFRSKLGIAAALNPLYEKFWWMAPFVDLAMNSYPFATRLTENIKPSLEYTGRLLDDGWNVLIFPEGRMNRSDEVLQPLKGGTGILAIEMQVPIVPMAILGTDQIMPPDTYFPRKRGEVTIRFGKPLSFSPGDNPIDTAQSIEKALQELIRQDTRQQEPI